MPVVFSAQTSTDAGNLAKFGADGGLFVGPFSSATNSQLYVIDNSGVGSGRTGVFAQSAGLSTTNASTPTAWVWPVMFTKACRVAAMAGSCFSAGAGYALYNAMYASSPVNGLPTTKVTDLSSYTWSTSFSNTYTPFVFTMTNTTQVYAASTLYWIATWAAGGTPVMQVRGNQNGWVALRSPTLPASSGFYSNSPQSLSYVESATNSQFYGLTTTTGPSTLTLTGGAAVTAGSVQQYAPFYYWQLTNV